MEKKEIKVGDRIIPVEAGKVIPMTKEEWKRFQKQMRVERDYFYMIGNKKYVHYENEDYVRVSDIEQELDRAREEGKITEDTSDGYHTFKELYEYRKLYNAGMFNLLPKSFNVHKSKRHSDGKLCFGGDWFIVMATLPTGQISNHYELKDWDLFKCEEREKADEWDGHTPEDVARRIKEYLN